MKMIRFDQAFQDVTKDVTKIPRKEYLSHGRYPIVDQGDGKIAGYTNRNDGLYTDVPVVLFGDHTRVFKYVDFPFFAGADGTKILKARSGIDAHFGYYSFMQYPLISLGYSRHFKLLKERTFHTFDYATQLRIAGVLGSIDEKIELNRKKIAELEALAKSIYDYWFVQFDFPDANGKPYKSSGGKMVWNEQLKREVPEGWNIGTIGDMGEIVSGGTPSTSNASYWSSQGIAWITPKDLSVTSNKYIRHGEHDISENGLHNSSAQLMPRKSVMLSTRAPIGYIAVADWSEFIYYAVSAMIPFIKSLGVGSTFAEVSKSSLSSVQSILPPQHICSRFDEIASSIGNERLRCELEIENVVELRDVLLPLLMNGQVVVG